MENEAFAPPNILLVDDVSENLVMLSEVINDAGYIAYPVNSVRQAVNLMETITPSLILLDISMPEMDGFTFCEMLKRNTNTRDIPVIFISAFKSPEYRLQAFRLGAVDYILKPFDTEEVMMHINVHLKSYKKQQEFEAYHKKLYKIINDQIHKIYEEQRNVIISLAKMGSIMNKSRAAYLDRVGKNCRILTLGLQLSPKFRNQISDGFVDAVEVTSPLCDIGKGYLIQCAMREFGKTGPPDKDIMKLHVEVGTSILEDIYSLNENNEFIEMAIDIAKHHHENWDGSGYPMGLAGTAIPLSARIVAIVDAYDSLITEQANRPAYSHEDSMKIINDGAGILFDPDMVSVFNKIQFQLKK